MKAFMAGFIGGLLFWPVLGSAELYTWTDDQGNFHITDTPPPVAQKKSATAAPIPRSALPKKAKVRPILPGQSQAEVRPVPGPITPSPAGKELPISRAMEGLSPSQATLTSSWQIFDGMDAKAPIQRWKDERGLDHFVDVLSVAEAHAEAANKSEKASVSGTPFKSGGRGPAVSPTRRHIVE